MLFFCRYAVKKETKKISVSGMFKIEQKKRKNSEKKDYFVLLKKEKR